MVSALALSACGGGSADSGSSEVVALKSQAATPALQRLSPVRTGALLVEGQQVIRNEAEWQAFWSQHPDNPVPVLEGVDFSQQMLLAVTGLDTGCGLKLAIQSVEADTPSAASSTNEPAAWLVRFEQAPPQTGTHVMCPDMISSVVDVVIWPRSDAPVRFARIGAK